VQQRGRGTGSLYDILELILDKGLVIDVFVRVSLVGIELLTIDARIVVASVDTYLRFAEACNRLDLYQSSKSTTLPELLDDVTEKGAKSKTKGVLTGAAEALAGQLKESLGGRGEEEEVERPRSRTRRTGRPE
jgi:hypothetical protein